MVSDTLLGYIVISEWQFWGCCPCFLRSCGNHSLKMHSPIFPSWCLFSDVANHQISYTIKSGKHQPSPWAQTTFQWQFMGVVGHFVKIPLQSKFISILFLMISILMTSIYSPEWPITKLVLYKVSISWAHGSMLLIQLSIEKHAKSICAITIVHPMWQYFESFLYGYPLIRDETLFQALFCDVE